VAGTPSRRSACRHKKRSGIPIAPSETESAAGRDFAKRPPPSPMRMDCRGCRERFPRKDPGVFDLLGSSLSCDATGLTPPNEHLCLRDTELCIPRAQTPRSSHLALADGHPKRPTKQGGLFWGRLLGCLLGLLFVFVVRGIGVVTAHTHDLSCLLPNQERNKEASADRPVQGSAVTPHNGLVFFHPCV